MGGYIYQVMERKMNNINNQKGLTAISIVFILIVAGFAVLVFLRLLPIYMENFSVSSHVSKLNDDSALQQMSDDEILVTLRKRFGVDNVENVKDENVIINRDGGNVSVEVDYEVRTPLLGNVEAVVVFAPKGTDD